LQDYIVPLSLQYGAAKRSADQADRHLDGTSPAATVQSRRDVIGAAALAAAGLCAPCARDASAQSPPSAPAPRMARPAVGDVLIFAAGDKAGKPVSAGDLVTGGPQVLAWVMEPETGVVRSGSRLNQVILVRLDPAELDVETAARSANGIVAYSAICTHAQCSVSEFRREKGVLHCPCHQSEFDPRQGGKVAGGPAQRPLAALPLKTADGVKMADGAGTADGVLVVARPFVGRVGASS
jgi:rieske iron-sulfur protein